MTSQQELKLRGIIQSELREAMSTSKSRPELEKAANKLADYVLSEINKIAPSLKTKEMPYAAQWILEEVVAILKDRI